MTMTPQRRLLAARGLHLWQNRQMCSQPQLSPAATYQKMVQNGKIREDDRQVAALVQLDRVWNDLVAEAARPPEPVGMFDRLLGKSPPSRLGPKGLYMYGGVGCGKTFIMDVFFDCAPLKKKRRTHFHGFMLEVHNRLHELRKGGGNDNIEAVAAQIVEEDGKLFCFDEFNVTDIADAMTLRVLFDKMFQLGATLVTTSNRHPTELYKNGINRELFVPCIHALQEHCIVYDLASQVDFRLLSTQEESTYVITDGQEAGILQAEKKLDLMFDRLTKGYPAHPQELITQGRHIKVSRSVAGVAWFSFEELCNKPVGAADFLAIARAYHTVVLHTIPRLSLQRLPEVRRLITLVDVLYDQKVKLLCSAVSSPFKIFEPDKDSQGDEAFAFDRTASRLQDMQSEEYKAMAHIPPPPDVDEHGLEVVLQLRSSLNVEADIEAIWNKYDVDGNGTIDADELRAVLEDVSLIKAGHRNVPDELLYSTLQMMDDNGDGVISKEEFKRHSQVSVYYI